MGFLKSQSNAAMTATAQTFTVYSRRDGEITFQSALADSEVQQILAKMSSKFAQDLCAKFSKLSEKQYAWAHKLAVDSVTQAQQVEKNDYNFSGIVDAITSAQMKGLKRIKLRFQDFIIKPSKIAGRVYVLNPHNIVEGNYGPQPEYMGWIEATRTNIRPEAVYPNWVNSSKVYDEDVKFRGEDVIEALQAVAQDVTGAAKLYGQETGNCGCCGRELTVRESIERGIGPICAERFGLL